MSSLTLSTLFFLGTVVLCNAEYRYKFRPPRMPAPPGAIYKKYPMIYHPQASNRAYRKPPTIYRYPPPPPPPKRPPSYYRRPYKSSTHVHVPMWKPKPIFPNPYQHIPVSLKDQQFAGKGHQYFKDPQLKEPVFLKNPKFYNEYVLHQPPASPALTSSYHPAKPAKPQPPQQQYSYPPTMHQHFQLADVADLDGPIRTIPAPNLSGASGNFAYPTSKPLTYQQPVKSSYVGNSIGSSVSLPQPPTSAALYQHAIPTRSPAVHQYHVTEEPSNDVRIKDHYTGAQTLFAPDPDPSLPTAPVLKAVDIFSTPSNGKPLPHDVQPYQPQKEKKGLTTQEFYDLLNSFPLPHAQETPSNVYQPTHQPQLQQHLLQQAHGFPIPTMKSALTFIDAPANAIVHHQQAYQIPDNTYLQTQQQPVSFQPQYQTFNYVEPGTIQFYQQQTASDPQITDQQIYQTQQQQVESEYQSQASQRIPSILPLVEPETENDLTQQQNVAIEPLQNQQELEQLINPAPEASPESETINHNVKMDNAFSRNYFTTLPNRQAAETLATLQAAGNINSNLMNILKKKQQFSRSNQEKKIAAENSPQSSAQVSNPSPATPVENSTNMRIYVPDYNDSYEDSQQASAEINKTNKSGERINTSQERSNSSKERQTSRRIGQSTSNTTPKIVESTIHNVNSDKKS